MKSIGINRNTGTKRAKEYLHLAVTEKGLSARGQIILLNKCFPGPLFCQKLSAMPPKGYVDIINGVEKLRQFLLQMRLTVEKLANIIII